MPQAAFFAQLLNIQAILSKFNQLQEKNYKLYILIAVFVSCWIRYKQVNYIVQVRIPEYSIKQKCDTSSLCRLLNLLNYIAMIVCLGGCYSGICVANFRVNEALIIHTSAAATLFGASLIYGLIMVRVWH